MNSVKIIKEDVSKLYTDEVDIDLDYIKIKTANISKSRYGGMVHVLNIQSHPHNFRDDIHKLIKYSGGYWSSAQKGWVLYVNMSDKTFQSSAIKEEFNKFLKTLTSLEIINTSIIDEVKEKNKDYEIIVKELKDDGFYYKSNTIEASYHKEINKVILSFKYNEELMKLVRKADPEAFFNREDKTWVCTPIIISFIKELKNDEELKEKEYREKQLSYKSIIDELNIGYNKDNVFKLKIVPNYISGFFEFSSDYGLLNNTWLKNYIFNELEHEVDEACFKKELSYNGILRTSLISKDILSNKKTKFLVPLHHYDAVGDFIGKLDIKFMDIGSKIYKFKNVNINSFQVHDCLFNNNLSHPVIGFFYVDNKPMMCIGSSMNNKGHNLVTYVEIKNTKLLEEYFGFKLNELVSEDFIKERLHSNENNSVFVKRVARFIQAEDWKLLNKVSSDVVIAKFVNAIESIILTKDFNEVTAPVKKMRL